ncbi:MAG: hypothetical protein BWY48_00230 [Parcubacteria group bacterium ADurb.Bin305]|nr:MAG: hypothetical protein BWY48_00230 [Parcubacteria group bacterium ADurb.Bin305]
MDEELNFEKFYSSLPDDNSTRAKDDGYEVKRWIDRNRDPKMRLVEALKPLTEEREVRRLFLDWIKRAGLNAPLNFQVPYADSDSKFDELESCALGAPMRKKLIKAYNSFFEDEQRVDEITSKIKDFHVAKATSINYSPNCTKLLNKLPALKQKLKY